MQQQSSIMILSAPVTEKIRQALLMKDWGGIDTIVADSSQFKEKRARALMQRTVNEVILDSAFQNNMPETLLAIRTIPPEGADDFFLMVLNQYIKTGNKKFAIKDCRSRRAGAHIRRDH